MTNRSRRPAGRAACGGIHSPSWSGLAVWRSLGSALALLAGIAFGGSAGAAPQPTIRPTLVSDDPAGDDLTVCYVDPQRHDNGSVDSPRATPSECKTEITDTLSIQFADYSSRALVVTGPDGFYRTLSNDEANEFYIDLGMPIGAYMFAEETDKNTPIGGFTVRPSTQRALQLRFRDLENRNIDHLALAGYSPGEKPNLYVYYQVSFEPAVGTGKRTWAVGSALGYVTADGRGEARVELPVDLFKPGRNYLIVSDPMQQNDLNSGRVMLGNR